jgi:hypothetical protein
MRATASLCAVFCMLLALPITGAQADIKPLPKPAGVTAVPTRSEHRSLIAPVSKPVVSTTVRRDPPQGKVKATTPVTPTRLRAAVPAVSFGGREQPRLAVSGGGRATPVLPPAVLAPTPLGMARAGGPRPAFRDAWPPWMFALLTLLALAEAGLLAQLVRSSPARAGRT